MRRHSSEERVHHDGVQTDKVVTGEERDLLRKGFFITITD